MSGDRLASLIAGAARILAGATVRTLGFVPDTRQRVYYANHTSHLDSIVLWSALPHSVRRVTRPVAARDYWEATRMRRFLAEEVFRAVLIERHPTVRSERPIDKLVAEMADRFSLIVFPEGTRGTGDEVAPFKGGLYHLARSRPDVEIVPVFIENMNRILPKGALVPVPLISSITIGRPLTRLDDEPKAAFLDRARHALVWLKEKRGES